MFFHVLGSSVPWLPASNFLSLPQSLKGLNISHDLYVFSLLAITVDRCNYQGGSVIINKHTGLSLHPETWEN